MLPNWCLLGHNYIYCSRYDPRERTRDMDWNSHYITQTYDGGEPLQQALQSLTFSGLPIQKRALGDSERPARNGGNSKAAPARCTSRLISPLRHRYWLTLLAVSASIRVHQHPLEHAIYPEYSAGACVAILAVLNRIKEIVSPSHFPLARCHIAAHPYPSAFCDAAVVFYPEGVERYDLLPRKSRLILQVRSACCRLS